VTRKNELTAHLDEVRLETVCARAECNITNALDRCRHHQRISVCACTAVRIGAVASGSRGGCCATSRQVVLDDVEQKQHAALHEVVLLHSRVHTMCGRSARSSGVSIGEG